MKIKNEAQFEAMQKKLDHYLNVEGGNDEGPKAEAMYDALAAWEEYEEACEYAFENRGIAEHFDSEFNKYPTPSDADSGL